MGFDAVNNLFNLSLKTINSGVNPIGLTTDMTAPTKLGPKSRIKMPLERAGKQKNSHRPKKREAP